MEERRPPVRRLFRLGLARPRPREAVDWEIEHHLAELADRLVEKGWGPEEAAREAVRRFGGVRAYRRRLERLERRRARMARWTGFTVAAWEALRGSVRSLARQPGLGAAVVLTLGLGIGANAAMFTILDRLFFQPPAHVEDADEVRRVLVERTFLGSLNRGRSLTYPDVADLREHAGLEAVAAYGGEEVTLGSGADASRVRAILADHQLIPLLGVEAAWGRFFDAGDDRAGAPPVVVVGHEFWTRALGGDPGVLGRSLELSGRPFTVVGVAPAGFTGVDLSPADVWLPLRTAGPVVQGTDTWLDSRGHWWLHAVVRLRDDIAPAAAADEATRLHRNGRREQIEGGRYDPDVRVALDPLSLARGPDATAESRVAAWLGGVSLLLLFIVCANVANLLLARGTRRQREMAVRLALGVSRRRLVAATVLESVLLGLVGSLAALGVAYWGGMAIRRALLPHVLFPATLGLRVVAFTLALALVAGLLSGIAPGLQATRLDLARDLGQGGRGSTGRSVSRAVLTVGQAALSVLLLVGAGLFVRSVAEVRGLDLGLDIERLVVARLEIDQGAVPAPGDTAVEMARIRERNELYAAAERALARVPGVEAVAATGSPFGSSFGATVSVPGWDSLPTLPGGGPLYYYVSPGYLRTVGLRLLGGRGLEQVDAAGARPVAVVSETMARTLWPDEGALGRCIRVGPDEACTTVVGVVEDAARYGIDDAAHMAFYVPLAQQEQRAANGLYVRAAAGSDLDGVVSALATALRGLDSRVRFAEVETLREILDPQARSWTLGAALFTVFGGLALLVAGIGLYGLLAFHVAQRTRELGIRSALGAARGRLLAGVVGDGARLTLLGVVVGLGLAILLGRFAEPLLFQVSPRDPLVLVVVAATLVVVGLIASLLPGLRATRVDPMDALRVD